MLSPLAFTNPQPIFFDDAMLASLGLTVDLDRTTGFAPPMQAFADDDTDDDKDGDDEEDDLDEDEDDAEDDEEDDAEDDEDDTEEDDTEEETKDAV